MAIRKSSVEINVVIAMVTITTVLLGALAAYNYFDARRLEVAQLCAALQLDADQIAASLVLPIWNIDAPQVDSINEGMMRDTILYESVIRSAGTNTLLSARRRDQKWVSKPAADESHPLEMLKAESNIFYSGQQLAHVTMYATTQFVEARLKATLVHTIKNILELDVILIISLFLILRFWIFKPLREVKLFAEAVTKGQRISLGRSYRGELESLRGSIEKMIGQLDLRYVQLQNEIAERLRAEAAVTALNADLERRVMARTEALSEANKELESFSYTVSHDLRAPLRAIIGFTQMILDEHGGTLDTEGTRLLVRVTDRARRMGQLIDDLLGFARMSRQDFAREAIDMNACARDAASEVFALRQNIQVSWPPENLPGVVGDRAMLRQVWINLFTNAAKFSGTREVPKVEIDFSSTPKEVTFVVRDNGVGFDMAYANKLFGVFQRLHSVTEFEGTGIGLAFVNRIIRRHGGTIWADSELDHGAIFSFTLPRAPAEGDVSVIP